MSDIKAPKFLEDLYADLRDRHLLIPAIALVVAIFAAPMLLKGSAEKHTSSHAAAPAEATSIQPAVLASNQVGVRDYRKRLADLKSKNPFEQQFANAAVTDTTAVTDSTATSDTSATPSATATDTGPPSGVGGPTSTDSGFPGVTPSTPGSSGNSGDSNNGGSGGDSQVVHELFTRRVDVKVGPHGDTKLQKDVKPMTILPDESTPVVAFLGTDEGGKRAAFVVSSDVTAVSGVGTCVPSLADCLYVTLRKGEQVSLDYGPDGLTYDLKLIDIRDVKVKQ
jgi:hypothetical protein